MSENVTNQDKQVEQKTFTIQQAIEIVEAIAVNYSNDDAKIHARRLLGVLLADTVLSKQNKQE